MDKAISDKLEVLQQYLLLSKQMREEMQCDEQRGS